MEEDLDSRLKMSGMTEGGLKAGGMTEGMLCLFVMPRQPLTPALSRKGRGRKQGRTFLALPGASHLSSIMPEGAGRTDLLLLKAHWVKTGFAGSLRHDIQFAQHFFQMAVHLDLLENIIDCALLINDEGCAFDAHELPAVERFFFPHAIGL